MGRVKSNSRAISRPDNPFQQAAAVAAAIGVPADTVRRWHYRPGGIRAGLLSWFQRQQLQQVKSGGAL